jgi:hypothetical protein
MAATRWFPFQTATPARPPGIWVARGASKRIGQISASDPLRPGADQGNFVVTLALGTQGPPGWFSRVIEKRPWMRRAPLPVGSNVEQGNRPNVNRTTDPDHR